MSSSVSGRDEVCVRAADAARHVRTRTFGEEGVGSPSSMSAARPCSAIFSFAQVVSPMSKKLAPFVNSNRFADVTFYVGADRKTVYAHKLHLAEASAVWASQFYGSIWLESKSIPMVEVELPDMELNSFLKIIQFAYTAEVELDVETVFPVLHGAEKYQLLELRDLCCQFLDENITIENCCRIYSVASAYSLMRLKKRTQELITRKSTAIFGDSKCCIGLSATSMCELLQLEHDAQEIQLFRCVLEWGKSVCEERGLASTPAVLQEVLKDLLPLIRFDLMGTSGLEEVKMAGVMDLNIMVDMLLIIIKNRLNVGEFARAPPPKKPDEIRVLLLPAARTAEFLKDVEMSFMHGSFKDVVLFNAGTSTPTLQEMVKFDVIMTFSSLYHHYDSPLALGNDLAEFVEHGGGLVLCRASFSHGPSALQGRLMTENFLPLTQGMDMSGTQHHMGCFDKNHPMMERVTNFDGGSDSFRSDSKLVDEATMIAAWDDGIPLVASLKKKSDYGAVVVLNFFPPSDKVTDSSNFWRHTTDGDVLLTNAVMFAANSHRQGMF